MAHNHQTADVIHVDDAAGSKDLRRLLEDAIAGWSSSDLEKTWRI